MSHVFISYATEDRALALQVRSRLASAQKKGWLDADRITVGSDYRREIDEALRSARALVLVLTPYSSRSQYVTYEWSFALGAGVPVLPLLARRTRLHPRLEPLHYLDFTGASRPWARLVSRVAECRNRPSSPAHAEPQIFARFALAGGKPIRQGPQYQIEVGTRSAPAGTDEVSYEILDDTFKKDPRWSVPWGKGEFEDSIFSYGDVFLTAKGIGHAGPWRARASLVEALKRGYEGRRLAGSLAKAFRDIEDN